MSEALIAAANVLSKREQPRVVAAMGLFFQRLAETGDTISVEDALLSYRGGAWGEDAAPGVGFPILRSTNMRGPRADVNDPAWCLVPSALAEACELRTGDILVTKASGSIDLVGKAVLFHHPQDDQRYLFSNFVLRLRPDPRVVLPEYISWFLRSPQALMWRFESQQNAVGLRNLKTKAFLGQCLPLPDSSTQKAVVDYLDAVEVGDGSSEKMEIPLLLTEQRRIVSRIDELATKIAEAKDLRREAEESVKAIYESKLQALTKSHPETIQHIPFTKIARLERRPVIKKSNQNYYEIGVYCFGKGIFHKPPRSSIEVGDKDLYWVQDGDFVLQITFAWEGAVALAGPAENNYCGSVRYLTFRVDENVCHPHYLLTYMKSKEGIRELARISPGSAGRNRVLSVKRLAEIMVPVVPGQTHLWLADSLQSKVDALKALQAQTAAELDALLPSVLDRAFSGRL